MSNPLQLAGSSFLAFALIYLASMSSDIWECAMPDDCAPRRRGEEPGM